MALIHRKLLVLLLPVLFGWAPCALGQTPITTATISPDAPSEVVDGAGIALPVNVSSLPIDFFDDFSWRSFVALNWPAKVSVRGEPERGKTPGDPGRRVWETWKASYEVLLPKGADPKEWSSFDGPTPCPDIRETGSGLQRVLGSFEPFDYLNQAGFGILAGPLVCQNRTYSRFEARVNREEFEFIRTKRLYLRSVLDSLTEPLKFTDGSIEVKVAWRECTPNDDAELVKSMYTIEAHVLDPKTGKCDEKKMGLVGLHIVHKTPLRPQWVWSSFEHVKNIPSLDAGGPTAPFAYNSGSPPQSLVPSSPPPSLDRTTYKPSPGPMQVVRFLNIHSNTKATNQRYQKALKGTVWANYQLVVTQWPTVTMDNTQPFPEDIPGTPFPDATMSATSVSNTSMETYFQTMTSCMDCHDTARQSKSDFVFFLQLHAFNDALTPTPPRIFRLLSEKLETIGAKSRARELQILRERQ